MFFIINHTTGDILAVRGSKTGSSKRRSLSGSEAARSGRRRKTIIVKSKGKGQSSTRWLQRQLNDPYVHAAQDLGYRSRSAFKLLELNDKFKFLNSGKRVVDLGAAPGGWSQVAAEKVGKNGCVVAVDIQCIEPLPNVISLNLDIYSDRTTDHILEAIKGPADIVLSDMASKATGHAPTDHLRVMALVEAAEEIASILLAPHGTFIAKVFKGGTEAKLLKKIKDSYANVKHAKPPASRSGSPEEYVIAMNFLKSKY
mgnify:CR=1 FL=1